MIDTIFSVINFVIICWLVFYLVRRFIVPGLKQSAEQDRLYMRNLSQELKELTDEQAQIEIGMKEQEEHCKHLMIKVSLWREKVEEEKKQQKLQEEEVMHTLQEQSRKQAYLYELKRIQRKIAPVVLSELEQELTNYFADNVHAHSYIDRIIATLTSSTK